MLKGPRKGVGGRRASNFEPPVRPNSRAQGARAPCWDEEQNVFPRLRQGYSPEDLHRLGDKVRRAKKFAPTRPHPGAPGTRPRAGCRRP
ncbi:hypothetical protein SSAG_06291 [Streptomyces sp. Mg1]|nr:hypothetical protein SSAG_06291 [Streptomyces sp. Mg1]